MSSHADVYHRLRELLDPPLYGYVEKGFSWPAAVAVSALERNAAVQRSVVELCVELGWCDQAASSDPEDALRQLLIDSPTLPPPHQSRWW